MADLLPRIIPNETMFFVPTTRTRAGPGLLGYASAAKCVVVMRHTMKPNCSSVQPIYASAKHNSRKAYQSRM
jgi:hypothetical protein